MEFIKRHRTVTQWYDLVDGPIMDTTPTTRLTQGRFKVEKVSVTWVDGEARRVFVRGQAVLADGRRGKLYHDRNLMGNEFPEWLDEVLDISL